MLTMPFTIGVFMVRDFEAAKDDGIMHAVDEQVVGRLTGLLVSADGICFSLLHTPVSLNNRSESRHRKPTAHITG